MYTATAIPFKYSFSGNCAASATVPHSCVCERFIYSQDQSTYFLQQKRQTHRGNIKIAHLHMNVEIGTEAGRPNSFSGNAKMGFLLHCVCFQMVLETLGWGREPREDVSFVLEARLHFTQPTDVNWRNLFSVKMAPVSAILVTLGQNTLTPTLKFERYFTMCSTGLVLIGGLFSYPYRQMLTLESYKNYRYGFLGGLKCVGHSFAYMSPILYF